MEILIIFLWVLFGASIAMSHYYTYARIKRCRKLLNKLKDAEKNRSEGIIKMYEFILSRALNSESIEDCKANEVFDLYVNINELYYILSMYHNETFEDFINKMRNNFPDDYGCDADDIELPKFPAKEKSETKNKVLKHPNPPAPPSPRNGFGQNLCYKSGGECKHNCPGQCRESC